MLPENDLLVRFRHENMYVEPEEEDEFALSPEKKAALKTGASSLLIPGLGQTKNGQWVKGGVMLAVDIAAFLFFRDRTRDAQRVEKQYHAFGDANFSVVKYAAWLVEYNSLFETSSLTLQDLANPGQTIDPNQLSANARDDWQKINVQKLRELEMQTLFGGTTGNAFSHVMPDYGSQQYYELMSKYFQYGPGWKDYSLPPGQRAWGKSEMSPSWFSHGLMGRTFNDDYRAADHAVSLMVLNHLVSAADAFLVRSKKVHATTTLSSIHNGLMYGVSVSL
jgi:hypothetical protein